MGSFTQMKAQQTHFLWPMDQMTSTKVLKCIKTNVAQIECNGPYDTLGVTVAKFYQNQLKLPQTVEKYQILTTFGLYTRWQILTTIGLYVIHFSHH